MKLVFLKLKNILTQTELYCRYADYIDSLAHLFSTGQGVIIERSAYSDIVFVEALYRNDLITKTSYKGLIETRNNSLVELLKPHLVIYLDVPVNATLVSKKFNIHI